MPIPTYEVWMQKTAGAFYERRNAYLQGLDSAIQAYTQSGRTESARQGVRQALDEYLADHQRRKGDDSWKQSVRNKNRALEDLRDEFYRLPVPPVAPPPEPTPPPPPIQPPSIVRDPATRATLEALMERRKPIMVQRVQAVNQAETALLTKVNSISIDLTGLLARILAASERARNEFFNASNTAFDTFEDLHKKDAQDIDFKLSIARKIFEAMEGLPFPLSYVGKAGSAVTGALKTETFQGSTNVLQTTTPVSSALVEKAKAAAASFDDLRTLNVAPSKLTVGRSSFQNDFRSAFRSFETELDQSWKKSLEKILNDEARRAFVSDLMSSSETQMQIGPSDMSGTLWWTNRVSKMGDEFTAMKNTIEGNFREFSNLNLISYNEVARWIVVLLIADYAVSGICGGRDMTQMSAAELSDKAFGDAFVNFLADPAVGIVQIKTTSGQSAGIWEAGKIPWQGHPNHKVGLLLYLNWARTSLNPFKFFNRQDTPEAFMLRSQTFIKRLGAAIRANEVSHLIGHKTIDDLGAVVRAVK
jgi:hypothetical protein